MNDDIVTRLQMFSLDDGTDALNQLLGEAADEIERLREWKELAYQLRNKYWWAIGRKTLKKFDAMHKADWALPKNVALRQRLSEGWGK